MVKVTLWKADGEQEVYVGAHISMAPEEQEVTIMDDHCEVIEVIPYTELIDIKVDLLEE